MSHPVIRRRSPRSQRRRDGLIQYARSVHSQNGEDGILARLFTLLPPPPPSTHRWCVDVGAWDGQHLSNTHELFFSSGEEWRGVLLEADTERFAHLEERHKNTGNICLNVTISAASPEDPQNLCNLLRQDGWPLPKVFDFLCIDIDGADYWVWHDLLAQQIYNAKVVCIEFNPTMPDDLVYVPPRGEQRHGASLAALVELAQAHAYTLVETTLYNAFFVQYPLYEHFLREQVPDTSIEALHESTMVTSLYQLYDGTIKLWGCKKLLWHRIALDENKLQVLPENKRNFPFAPTAVFEEDMSKWSDQAVDFRPYRTYSEDMIAQRGLTYQKLLNQLKTDGFALVRGTGMDPQICREALKATQSFLQDADESVRHSCLSPTDRARRGYAPMNVENFASLLGQHGAPNDLVRKFRMGPVDSGQSNNNHNSLLQPNIWPVGWDESDTFRTAVETYYQSACEVAGMVMRAICQGLVQKHPELESALEPLGSSPSVVIGESGGAQETTTSILTLLGYRTGTRHKGKNKGPLVAAHTDVGVITILLFDGGNQTCAGLQRSDGNGGWVDVELPTRITQDPIFVVNVADCLSDLSGGRVSSTVHRVIAKRGQQSSKVPRNCLALFVGLDPQCLLSIDGEQISYEEWRRRRIERSQEVLKSTQPLT